MDIEKYYQVSTLQALALGYSKSVITVGELLKHGNLGLGTFEDVDGEMIVLDGKCYRARNNGDVTPAEDERGVPFASVCHFHPHRFEECEKMDTIEKLKEWLTRCVDDDFGDGIEQGIEKGRLESAISTLNRYIRRKLPIDAQVLADIAEDNKLTVDKVRTIAKDNGISLSR